jgi:pSer/pThr/pTyr-binding forkhead associated (FHA) protein
MAGRLFPAGGGASIPLTNRVMIIGRAQGCDIRLADPIVSNRHCVLQYDGGHWLIEDLASRNGTRVNGLPVVKPMVLKTGDTLIISAKFRFVIEYSPSVERNRFAGPGAGGDGPPSGDDRNYLEHGPATKRLEPQDKDIWSKFEG